MHTETLEPSRVTQEPSTIWSRSFLILFFSNMVFNMGLNMSNSLLSIYSDYLGASASVVGMVASSVAVSSIIFRLISAPIMDTYNRKYLVVFAALLLSVAFLGFSTAGDIPTLVGFRLLQGCAMAFGNASCLAMVADILPRDKYNSGLGYYSLAQVACSAVGPSVGLALVGWAGFRVTYTLTSGIMLLAAFLTFLIKLDFKKTKKLKFSFHNAVAMETLLPVGLQFIIGLSGAGVYSFLILMTRERGITGNIGLYFTVSAVTMLVSRPFLGRLTDRFGLVKIAIPSMLFNMVPLFIIAHATTLPVLLLAAFIQSFGQGACMPALQALTMKAVAPSRRGAASSTNYIGFDMGSLIGPVIAGALVEAFGYNFMLYVSVIPSIAGGIILYLTRSAILRIEDDFAAQPL